MDKGRHNVCGGLYFYVEVKTIYSESFANNSNQTPYPEFEL